VDIEWVTSRYPSFSATITSAVDVTLTFPPDPVDHTMLLVEVVATDNIDVTCPDGTVLTIGPQFQTSLPVGKTGFFGFRYSATSGVWFLLSSTAQV
jgi:hypothetical protein